MVHVCLCQRKILGVGWRNNAHQWYHITIYNLQKKSDAWFLMCQWKQLTSRDVQLGVLWNVLIENVILALYNHLLLFYIIIGNFCLPEFLITFLFSKIFSQFIFVAAHALNWEIIGVLRCKNRHGGDTDLQELPPMADTL